MSGADDELRELAPWAADAARRRPPGRLADAVGDLRMLATGWHWDLAVDVVKAAASTAVGTVKGDQDAPPIPTAWARTPFLVAVRDLAQTGVLRPMLQGRGEPGEPRHRAPVPPVRPEPAGRQPRLAPRHRRRAVDAAPVLAGSHRRRAASDAFFHSWWKAGAAALAFNTFQLPQSSRAPTAAPFEVGPLRSAGLRLERARLPRRRAGPATVSRPVPRRRRRGGPRLSVPVLPVGMRGTYTAMPQGTRWPRQGRPRVAVR